MTLVTVPFSQHPDILDTGAFGAVVVSGDNFSARMADGTAANLE